MSKRSRSAVLSVSDWSAHPDKTFRTAVSCEYGTSYRVSAVLRRAKLCYGRKAKTTLPACVCY